MSANDEPKAICIFGSYTPGTGAALYKLAYELGFALARAGYTVVNGGYGGTMKASAKGAKDAGGQTVGVTCSAFVGPGGRRPRANPYIDREIHFDDPMDRIRKMIELASAFVVLPGGTGTLTEFATAWEYVCKRLIRPRPIFLIGDFWRAATDRITAERSEDGKHLHFVETPAQIVEMLTGPLFT